MACLQPLSCRVCASTSPPSSAAFLVLGEGSLERELRLGCSLGKGLETLNSPRKGPWGVCGEVRMRVQQGPGMGKGVPSPLGCALGLVCPEPSRGSLGVGRGG